MLTPFDKALVALFGSLLTVLGATPYGHVLADPALQASIISIVTAAVVYLVPNKVAALPVPPPPASPSA